MPPACDGVEVRAMCVLGPCSFCSLAVAVHLKHKYSQPAAPPAAQVSGEVEALNQVNQVRLTGK